MEKQNKGSKTSIKPVNVNVNADVITVDQEVVREAENFLTELNRRMNDSQIRLMRIIELLDAGNLIEVRKRLVDLSEFLD